ncbi:MAG: type II toxin-antitoxin system RelE/ParE family toxin [Bacteroidota bacterium]
MAIDFVISHRAEKDIEEAIDYYNEIRNGLGEKFYSEVLDTFTQIYKYNYSFAVRYNVVHAAPTKKFRFLIHYIVTKKTITILAVLHTSVNPEKWPSV